MGAIGKALAAFAQPLIDETDGSPEEIEKAFAVSTLCYNLALLPLAERETSINEMRPNLAVSDAEFEDFRRSLIDPMIRRHEEMFPLLHRRLAPASSQSVVTWQAESRPAASSDKVPPTDRYAPCPCNSGEKYKFCCGSKRR
jgi:uncharacterized protein YecA (UPF0149 family)